MLQSTIKPTSSILTQSDFDRLGEVLRSPQYRMATPRPSPLKDGLDRGTVVAPDEIPRNVITMRSTVRLRDLDSGESETYTLVYPHEANIEQSKVSVLAPLGTAMLGARVGQILSVTVPGGTRRLRIQRILYQPEAAGDLHL